MGSFAKREKCALSVVSTEMHELHLKIIFNIRSAKAVMNLYICTAKFDT